MYAHNDVLKTYQARQAGLDLSPAVGIICVSKFLASQIAENIPTRMSDRIRVVPNGVDVQFFRRDSPLRRSDFLRVVFVGRMIRDKGADILLKAIASLNRRDIHLTLVGSRGFTASDPLTKYEVEIRQMAASLGNRVSIRPFLARSEVASILSRSDVLVVPSRWAEPFALTVREGQAAGLAVIASNIGGIPEALGGHGVLVEPDDPSSLAEALEALAEDEDTLKLIGERARNFAELHDWSVSARTLEAAVAELTN
ncbi:glycosyltransferase family 4 protein [Ornithinimicrobium flavum]|uniref:glycosyltransferase family 4 protein n=1 Tax=Ornithinimicrobium flavum TaxID=1288636 RepID=UPI00130508EB|nr:glycosyltransferase family 4 protein [Ornithinimicrobium flavum]